MITTDVPALEDPITDSDLDWIITTIVHRAGPQGISEEELTRRIERTCDVLRGWYTAAALWEGFRQRQIVASAKPGVDAAIPIPDSVHRIMATSIET